MNTALRAAASGATILILGESGTGKEVLAHAIHAASPRADHVFIPVHCTSLSEGVIQSELFGHEKGAFTGASSRRIGRFEQAQGDTLFIDEVGDIPLGIQVQLLRVLQERTYERVGGNQTIYADVRIIAATNKDLNQVIQKNEFREDTLTSKDFPSCSRRRTLSSPETVRLMLPDMVRELETTLIRQALQETQGNQSQAARLLGLTERNLRYKLKKYESGELPFSSFDDLDES